jgi:hypothetical protein
LRLVWQIESSIFRRCSPVSQIPSRDGLQLQLRLPIGSDHLPFQILRTSTFLLNKRKTGNAIEEKGKGNQVGCVTAILPRDRHGYVERDRHFKVRNQEEAHLRTKSMTLCATDCPSSGKQCSLISKPKPKPKPKTLLLRGLRSSGTQNGTRSLAYAWDKVGAIGLTLSGSPGLLHFLCVLWFFDNSESFCSTDACTGRGLSGVTNIPLDSNR